MRLWLDYDAEGTVYIIVGERICAYTWFNTQTIYTCTHSCMHAHAHHTELPFYPHDLSSPHPSPCQCHNMLMAHKTLFQDENQGKVSSAEGAGDKEECAAVEK